MFTTNCPVGLTANGEVVYLSKLSGRDAYENAFSASSIANGTYQKASFDLVQPEKVSAIEAGYRGILGGFTVDFSGYYNKYEDFIGNKNVAVTYYGNPDLSDTVPVGPGGAPVPLALVALSNGDYSGPKIGRAHV